MIDNPKIQMNVFHLRKVYNGFIMKENKQNQMVIIILILIISKKIFFSSFKRWYTYSYEFTYFFIVVGQQSLIHNFEQIIYIICCFFLKNYCY